MLNEIEFELTTEQFALMGYPRLTQGQPLSVILDAGVLSPDTAAAYWFTVQQGALPARFVRVGRGVYAFTGQIVEAELIKADDMETATLLINADGVIFRATCAPGDDGCLPFGVWETRTITGAARLYGVWEDDYVTSVGRSVGMTIWRFRRLVLSPGDARFGEWYESVELPDSPYRYDRVLIEARLHRERL